MSGVNFPLQECDAARQVYRDANAQGILPKFQSVKNNVTRCMVIFTLAYIVTEEESDKINQDDKNIVYIIDALEEVTPSINQFLVMPISCINIYLLCA